MTRVSVCIRTHDRPGRLREAISSALDQRHPPFEVIVCDDGAGSGEGVVEEFADERLHYRRLTSSGGPAANLRDGFNAARGSFLALLDDDDRWHPDFLSTALSPFAGDPELGIVFTEFNLVAGDRRMPRRLRLAPGRHDDLLPLVLARSAIAPSAAVLRRELWEEGERTYPLLDDSLGATTMWIRALKAGWPAFYVDEPLVDLRLHAGQISWKPENTRREIALLERFRFTDEPAERTRHDRLAHAYMARAGFELRAGHARRAALSVRAARESRRARLSPAHWLTLSGMRAGVMRRLLSRPALLARLRDAWLRLGIVRP